MNSDWQYSTVKIADELFMHLRVRNEDTLDQMPKLCSQVLGYAHLVQDATERKIWRILMPDLNGNIIENNPGDRFYSMSEAICFLIDFDYAIDSAESKLS